VVKKLDKAAAHGVIHSNAAARVKSRLSGAIKAIKTKTAAK
jgi:ribosomal protein S20